MSIVQVSISMKHRLLLFATISIIAFVYCYRIGDKALDFDERFSMNIATGLGGKTEQYKAFGQFIATPLAMPVFSANDYRERFTISNVVSTAMNDNGQGLPYFITLHAWLKLWGVSGVHARTLSALFMLAALLFLYSLLLRLGFSPGWALITIALFGCNGVVIGMAQYVRFYSLGVLLTVFSFHLVRTLERKSNRQQALLLGLVWSFMFLNQFFSAFVIAGQIIFLCYTTRRQKQLQIALPIICAALVVGFVWLIPLGGWQSLRNIYELHQSPQLGNPALTMPASLRNTTMSLLSGFAGAFGQPVALLNVERSHWLQIALGFPALILAGLTLKTSSFKKPDWLWLCILILSVYTIASLLHTLVTGFTLLFQVRYWLFAYIFSYALLGWALAAAFQNRSRLKWIAVIVLALTCGRAFYTSASTLSGLSVNAGGQLSQVYVQGYEDYEGAASDIVHQARTDDTITYNSWITAQRVNWFLLRHPELIQRVDTSQTQLICLRNGSVQKEIVLQTGRTRTARPIWLK
jgi:uncharacterized membrane protein